MKRRSFVLLGTATPAFWLLSSCREGADRPAPESPDPSEGDESDDSDDDFVGLELEEAERLATRRRLAHRVTMRDGEPLPATMDYRPDRVNFEVEGGRVAKVTRG